jgi:hypothetical protein
VQTIFGRDVASLEGKITRQQLQGVLAAVANNLPKRIPFFLSLSKNIHFITAKVLDNRKLGSLVNALQRINGIYKNEASASRLFLVMVNSNALAAPLPLTSDQSSTYAVKMNMCRISNGASPRGRNGLAAHTTPCQFNTTLQG